MTPEEISSHWAAVQHQRALRKQQADRARAELALKPIDKHLDNRLRHIAYIEAPTNPKWEADIQVQYNALPPEQQTGAEELAILQQRWERFLATPSGAPYRT